VPFAALSYFWVMSLEKTEISKALELAGELIANELEKDKNQGAIATISKLTSINYHTIKNNLLGNKKPTHDILILLTASTVLGLPFQKLIPAEVFYGNLEDINNEKVKEVERKIFALHEELQEVTKKYYTLLEKSNKEK